MRKRHEDRGELKTNSIAQRLGAYQTSEVPPLDHDDSTDEELVERAATLLSVMPRNQLRAIEQLLSPNDLERGRRAVDALIDAAFAIEDETGHIRRTA